MGNFNYVAATALAMATFTSSNAVAEGPASAWEGLYAGVHAGAVDNETAYTYGGQILGNPYGDIVTTSALAFAGGIQAGYNIAIADSVIAGFEVGYSLTGAEDPASDVNPPVGGGIASSFAVDHKLTSIGAARGRLGYAVGDGLVFVTGGFAFGKQESEILVQPNQRSSSERQTLTGWTVGAGFAYKLTSKLSMEAEYAYTEFGDEELYNATYTVPVAASARLVADGDVHQMRVGLNFKF